MLKRNKNKIIISSLVILGIILILASSFQGKSNKSSDYDDYVDSLEVKIETFLKTVDGIKDADVIIMLEDYDTSTEETNSFFSTDNTSSSTTIPNVRGVAVACTNGDNYSMQVKVTEIVSSYLGISSNKIKIVALK